MHNTIIILYSTVLKSTVILTEEFLTYFAKGISKSKIRSVISSSNSSMMRHSTNMYIRSLSFKREGLTLNEE